MEGNVFLEWTDYILSQLDSSRNIKLFITLYMYTFKISPKYGINIGKLLVMKEVYLAVQVI